MADQGFALEMRGISKAFPGVKALDDVTLQVRRGHVHGIVGENGAGKSTLMKILNGVYTADTGTIYLGGEPATIESVTAAKQHGLSLIFQEFNLVNTLSVAENIFLGALPKKVAGTIDWKSMRDRSKELVDQLGFPINIDRLVGALSPAEKQLVEIAKALSIDARVLVMDEPTASLSKNESEKLFEIIRSLKGRGVTVIYISHRMDEVFSLCDELTVLRDGHIISTQSVSTASRDDIIEKMVGRPISSEFPARSVELGEVVLEARALTGANGVQGATFTLRRGEIVGIAGLVGAGRTELAECLFGTARIISGELLVHDRPVTLRDPADGKAHSIGMVTEDRKETGLVLGFDVASNISITHLAGIARWKFVLSRARETDIATRFIERMGIRTPSPAQATVHLSGGNQQKVVLSKWLFPDVQILILDEPTRGIDVGAKYEIYELMNQLVEQGKSLIMISSELPEVIGMSDRVLVMHGGRIVGELGRDEMTPEAVLNLAV